MTIQNLESQGSNIVDSNYQSEVIELREQKIKLQLSMDRLKLQLEQKKTQLALLHEKKAESELELKREKKMLLENFINLRNENKQLLEIINQNMQQPDEQNNFMDPSDLIGQQSENNFQIQNYSDDDMDSHNNDNFDPHEQQFNQNMNFSQYNPINEESY